MHLRYLYVYPILTYTYLWIEYREIIGKVEEPSSHFLNEAAGGLVIGAEKKNKNMCIFTGMMMMKSVCCVEKSSHLVHSFSLFC